MASVILQFPPDAESRDRIKNEAFQRLINKTSGVCNRCLGTGSYFYDHNHATVCEFCCPHDKGWWMLTKHHANPGELCCMRGCGTLKKDIFVDKN